MTNVVGQDNTSTVTRDVCGALTKDSFQSDLSALQRPQLLDQSINVNKPFSSEVNFAPTDTAGVLLVTATHKKSASEIPTASALLTYSGVYGVFSELKANESESALNARDAVMDILELGIKQFKLLGVEHISLKGYPSSLSSVVQAMGFRKCEDSGAMVFGKGKS